MLAWLLVGVALGWLMAPDASLAALAGFMISGVLCCGVLGVLTYPLSDHYLATLAGSAVGLAAFPWFGGWLAAGPLAAGWGELGLVSGALLGATSLVWTLPLRLAHRWWTATGTP
jgi:hypothetical protein